MIAGEILTRSAYPAGINPAMGMPGTIRGLAWTTQTKVLLLGFRFRGLGLRFRIGAFKKEVSQNEVRRGKSKMTAEPGALN